MDKTKILSRAELSRVSARLITSFSDGRIRWRQHQRNSALVYVTLTLDQWDAICELSDDDRFLANAVSKLQGQLKCSSSLERRSVKSEVA